MASVTVKASVFITKNVYFEHKKEDQVQLGPPVYNKAMAAEGYDHTLIGKLEIPEQGLIFTQDSPDSPIFLEELRVIMKDFRGTFLNMEFKCCEDKRIERGLRNALAKRMAG